MNNRMTKLFIISSIFSLSMCMAQTTREINNKRHDVRSKYQEGDFSTLENQIIGWKDNVSNKYVEVYLTLWHAKIKFCLGEIKEAIDLRNSLKTMTKDYEEILFHDLFSELIDNCEIDDCICKKGKLTNYSNENLDLISDENLSKNFFNLNLFIKKNENNSEDFDFLFYRIKRPRDVFDRITDATVKTQLFFPEKSKSQIKYVADESRIKEYELNHSFKNRLNNLNKEYPLVFNHIYTDNPKAYTTGIYNYIPKRFTSGRGTNVVEGYVLVGRSRYFFKAKKFERDKKTKKIPIIWDKDWELHDHTNKEKIRLRIHEDYVSWLEIELNDEGYSSVNDLKKGRLVVDNESEILSNEKWGEDVVKENFGTKEIELNLNGTNKIPGEEEIKEIKVKLTEDFEEDDKKLNRSYKYLISAILLNICLAAL